MKAPRGLGAAAFALWGWSNGQLALGIALGTVYEVLGCAPRSARAEARVAHVVLVCTLAACGLLAWTVATQSAPQSIYAWLRWLPLTLWPLLAIGQVAAIRPSAIERAFGRAAGPDDAEDSVDPSHPGIALTLAAAGTGTGAQAWLYPAFALIVGWAVLARVPRHRLPAAAILLLLAIALGHAIHTGLARLQGEVEHWGTELLGSLFDAGADPFKERTRIGALGQVKRDDRIVLRVQADGLPDESLLLREASYARYRNGEWSNPPAAPWRATGADSHWILAAGPAPAQLRVRGTIPGGEGVLALPPGTRAIDGLPADSVDVYAGGTVLAHGTPRFVDYDAGFDPAAETQSPDPATDLEIPPTLAALLERTVATNALRRATPDASAEAVRAFFARDFAYSLELGAQERTLADFLQRDRRGHCEYFASATVLLLRVLGIPARYAAGYSVQEYSERERAFVVRSRHAHAWAIAFVDGRWTALDTTPARWAEFEQRAARPFFGPVRDWLSWLADQAMQVWMRSSTHTAVLVVLIAAGVIVLPLVLRAAWRRGALRRRARPDAVARAWRRIESRLSRLGFPRADGETVRAWTRRLATQPDAPAWIASLDALAGELYRVRYDPDAGPEDARRFVRAASAWRVSDAQA